MNYAAIEFATFPGGYSPAKTKGDCYFDAKAAQVAIEFFPKELVHIKGELGGKPMELVEWQNILIGTMFGWRRPDGTRRYRVVFLFIPRKGGKSTTGAGVALLMLYLDNEPGAEIYSCAAEREQAAIVFEVAKQNVIRNPRLSKRSTPYLRSIVHKDLKTGVLRGTYKVISAEAATKHGYNPHGIIFDELHAQPNGDLWEAMQSGRGARRQPLTFIMTTAGHNKNTVCYEQYEYACKVRDGLVDDPSTLPAIYEAPKDSDWTLPETWRIAQPNLGVTVSEEFYREEFEKAKSIPSYENTFKRLYLNIWTEQSERWLPMHIWDKNRDQYTEEDLLGESCFGGLDLSANKDLTALVLLFKHESGYRVLPYFWCPEEKIIERSKRDRVDYLSWERDGFLRATPGDAVDYSVIRRDLGILRTQYDIKEIGFDTWNAHQLSSQLAKEDGFTLAAVRQGVASLSGPSKELERLLYSNALRHNNHPVMNWCASNVAVDKDTNDNIMPSKKKSNERIDGVVALVMAIAQAITHPDDSGSVYETPGSLSL